MKLQKRVEDPRLLRGEGQFIDDLIFPKMLHLVFVRSPYGHAKIKSINSSDALKKAVAVIDGKTVANETKPLYTLIRDVPYYGIAVGKARFFGEPVAMVAAETLGDALDASEEVYIDYEPLPPIVDPEEAVNSSNLVHENLGSNVALSRRLVFGEVEKMFAEA
ncbi:MAG: hypothetical protein NYU39_03515, partial [Aigarchaeota archaeon]|nr:hypothetical protein [Candidatus Caldarchaeales archaeon]